MKRDAEDRLIFFDLETGGLDPKTRPITEIGAVAVSARTLEPVETFHMRVSFDPKEADPKSLSISKYDPTLWATAAVPPTLVAEYFAQFLRRHATHVLPKQDGGVFRVAKLAGHNAETFDGPFIRQWYQRLSKFFPAALSVLDTKQRAMWLFEEHPQLARPENFKLGTLAAYFGTATTPDHSAICDVRATIEVYQAIQRQMLAVTESQQVYLEALARETGHAPQEILRRAIHLLVYDIDVAA